MLRVIALLLVASLSLVHTTDLYKEIAKELERRVYEENRRQTGEESSCGCGDVTFTAYLDHELNDWLGKAIPFNRVITNDGNGYDPNTGIFTCPKSGMYLLSFMVSGRGTGGEVAVKLVKNGENILGGVAETYREDQDMQGGNTVPLRLNKGDTVAVEVMFGKHVMGWEEYRLTSFSGVYLYA